ncbi:hypothetical protein U3516DRAFT_865844 [Neocallimastix sp. 'constans']
MKSRIIIILFSFLFIKYIYCIENGLSNPEDIICNKLFYKYNELPFKIDGLTYPNCTIYGNGSALLCKSENKYKYENILFELFQYEKSEACNYESCLYSEEKPSVVYYDYDNGKVDENGDPIFVEKKVHDIKRRDLNHLFIFTHELTVPFVSKINGSNCTVKYIMKNPKFLNDEDNLWSSIMVKFILLYFLVFTLFFLEIVHLSKALIKIILKLKAKKYKMK